MQEITFCAICALLRLDDGDLPGLVLAALPRGEASISHQCCSHHRLMLTHEEIDLQVTEGDRWHYNGTPVMETVGITQRSIDDQIALMSLIDGDPNTHMPGLRRVLQLRRFKWAVREWDRNQASAQDTVAAPALSLAELRALREEEAANEEMHRRIAGYLVLRAAGKDTGPVLIDDDYDDDRTRGEE